MIGLCFGFSLVACQGASVTAPISSTPESAGTISTPAPATASLNTGTPAILRSDCPLPVTAEIQPPALAFDTAILLLVAQPTRACLLALDAGGNRIAAFPSPATGGWKWDAHARLLALRDRNLNWNRPLDNPAAQRLDLPPSTSLYDYAFAPDGQQLVYLTIDTPTDTSRVWRLVRLDLRTRQAQVLLEHDMTEGVPQPSDSPLAYPKQPFGWSPAIGQIVLYGIVPNTDAPLDGVWLIRPDGSDFRLLLSGDRFVGRVALSPDGSRLAYLAYNPAQSVVPRWLDAIQGLAANQVHVLDLVSGRDTTVLAESNGGVLRSPLVWAGNGDLLVAHNTASSSGPYPSEWLAIALDGSGARTLRTFDHTHEVARDVTVCPNGDVLYWLEQDNRTVMLVRVDAQGIARDLSALPSDRQTTVRIVGCLR